MIDFLYVRPAHYSTIKPIKEELDRRGIPTRVFSFEERFMFMTPLTGKNYWKVKVPEDCTTSVVSWSKLVTRTKEMGVPRRIWHHHGISVGKGDLPAPGHLDANLLLVGSEFFKKEVTKEMPCGGIPEDRVKVVGYPKLDCLINNYDALKKKVEEQIELAHPIVFYAPSWFIGDDYMKMQKAIFEACKKMSLSLMVKHHDYNYAGKRIGDETLIPSYENIVPYYTIADILITTASSAAYEFAHLDRPIIQVASDVPYPFTDVGIPSSREEIEKNLKECIDRPEENSSNRKKWVMKVNIPDGKSTQRAAKVIVEWLEQQP